MWVECEFKCELDTLKYYQSDWEQTWGKMVTGFQPALPRWTLESSPQESTPFVPDLGTMVIRPVHAQAPSLGGVPGGSVMTAHLLQQQKQTLTEDSGFSTLCCPLNTLLSRCLCPSVFTAIWHTSAQETAFSFNDLLFVCFLNHKHNVHLL